MKHSSKSILPALLAFGLFAALPAMAGDKQAPEVDKNAPPVVEKGAPEVSKGGPEVPTPPSKHGDGGGYHYKTNDGGGGGRGGYNNIACVINGQVFYVNNIKQCQPRRSYVSVPQYRYQAQRRVVSMGCNCGGYAYPQPVYKVSRAARMQAESRARAEAMAYYGYGMGGGYAYGGGYAMGGYAYGEQRAVVKHKKHRKHARAVQYQMQYEMPAYEPVFQYNSGVMIHYGPTITKDGGY